MRTQGGLQWSLLDPFSSLQMYFSGSGLHPLWQVSAACSLLPITHFTFLLCIPLQAAEKMLLASLYFQDMEEAGQQNGQGPLSRTLTSLAHFLNNPRAEDLAERIQAIVGNFLRPLYPTFASCPYNRYSAADSHQVLENTRELLNILGQRFV